MSNDFIDCVIIGGGVVGLAIAKKFSKVRPVALIEKEASLLSDTSSRNSEVIHSGIYYENDSLKRKLCMEGKKELYTYCEKKNIPHKKIGKIIIGTKAEKHKIKELYRNGLINGLDDLKILNKKEIRDYEPDIVADYGIFSETSGILDTHVLGQSIANDVEKNGGLILKKTEFISANKKDNHIEIKIKNPDESIFCFNSKLVINAGGNNSLNIDKNINHGQNYSEYSYYGVKGNYFSYQGKNPFSHLIYPLPNKYGLGIHSTSSMDGSLKFGPDVDFDISNLSVDPNLKEKFLTSIRNWWPNIDDEKLTPDYSGIRPKVKFKNEICRDFNILHHPNESTSLISLFGIESPGITSCFAIANECERIYNRDLKNT